MNALEAVDRGLVTEEELFSPFLAELLPCLETGTLISMAKDLYHSIEPGPNWTAINAYHDVATELQDRGRTISIERVGPEDWAVIVSPNGHIPY